MNINSLKAANQLARNYGVKATIFGAPGSGKTPLCSTAPRPVMLVTEPGMLSMRGCNIPTFEAYTAKEIEEFFKWVFGSNEINQFDTIEVDSVSAMAEIILKEAEEKNKHGLKSYGVMSKAVMEHANKLYYMKQKHIVLVAKQMLVENGRQTIVDGGTISYEPLMQKRPFFPGKDLNVKMPHLFDSVLHLDEVMVPGNNQPQKALRTKEIPEVFARHRLGNLNELEPAHLGDLFKKTMS